MAMDPKMMAKLLMLQQMQQGMQPAQTVGGMTPQMSGGQQAVQGITPLMQAMMMKRFGQQPMKPPVLMAPEQPSVRQAINTVIPGQ